MKNSRHKSREHSSSNSKEISLFRNQSNQKSIIKMNNSKVNFNSNQHTSLTPDNKNGKEKDSPIRIQSGMQTIFERQRKINKTKKKKKEKDIKKKKQNYEVCLKQIKPINLQKQKQSFFELKGQYNPYFLYPNMSQITQHDKEYKGMEKAHDKYLTLAIRILEKSNKINYLQKLYSSPILTMEQTSKAFDHYIQYLQIEDYLDYEFIENTVAPTSVVHNNTQNISKVIIGLPIQYRQLTIMGVLNHEIGTHFLRKYNNRLQKWHKQRKKFNLSPYLKYQEGLAALNTLYEIAVSQKIIPPMLFPAALHYYSCFQASRMSFAQLYADLVKYQKDPQMRWRQCVRVKRGIADTVSPQGMYKDQIYLRGAIKILKNRKQLNAIDMHCGKLTLKDCIRIGEKKLFNYQKIKKPYFLNDLTLYYKSLDKIAKQNYIDEWFQQHQKKETTK